MDVYVVTVSSNSKYDKDCNIKVFKTELDSKEYIKSLYEKYEPRSKAILDEFKSTNSIQNIEYFNYPDLDELIRELIEDEEPDNEIIKSIINLEFVQIYSKKLKLELNSSLILNFDIL